MGEAALRRVTLDGTSTLLYTKPQSFTPRRLVLIVFHGTVVGTGNPALTMWGGPSGWQGQFHEKLVRALNLVLLTHTLAFNPGPSSNPVNSWMNAGALLKVFSWFGPGNLLDQLGCRYDAAWFAGGSQGAQMLGIFGQNYPSLVAGATFYAASLELERDRVLGGQSQIDINAAHGAPVGSVGQVDVDGTVTGHRTTVDPVTGLITPAWYYGTSIKGQPGIPRAGEIVTCCHPPNMNIWRDQIIGAGKRVDFYESLGDTIAGPTTGSFIPDAAGTGWLHGSGRIWANYVGAPIHTVSDTADHGELMQFLPTKEIAQTILEAA